MDEETKGRFFISSEMILELSKMLPSEGIKGFIIDNDTIPAYRIETIFTDEEKKKRDEAFTKYRSL